MLKKLSLRARLTLLSALVMAGAAILLTAVSFYSADHIFVQTVPEQLKMASIITTAPSEAAQPPSQTVNFSQAVASGNSAALAPDDQTPEADFSAIQITLAKAGRQFNVWGIVGLALVTLLGAGVTWLMAGRALRPVSELSGAIEDIGENDFSRRVDAGGRQDEIGHLAHSFNGMMDKVSASFERQKRFAASAAHELKTPLATMQVGLEVLELDAQPSPERMEKTLAMAKANTGRMIRLVDDLLRLSAEGTGEMDEQVQLSIIFEGIQSELAPQIRAKQLKVCVPPMPDITLQGSRSMLYRALFNLMENAVKYNRENGSVVVTAEREGEDVLLCIADTGIGIPADELPHIFEPFYRVDRSRSRAVGGSGLGLSLVQDIVEKHGGTVRAESTPGEGTVFTLRFPADKIEK